MNALKSITAIVASFFMAAAACAAGTATSLVAQKFSYGSITFYFPTSGATSGQPGCASSAPGRFAIDTNTANGVSFQRELATAFALGQTVTFTGTGTCTIAGGVEDLFTISVTQ